MCKINKETVRKTVKLDLYQGTWAGPARLPSPGGESTLNLTVSKFARYKFLWYFIFCPFALKCVLVSCHSLVIFGHPCVFVQLLSVVYPPHSLVCCRDKAQLGAALQRRTPHLQSSLAEGLQQMQFSCCRRCSVFHHSTEKKNRVIVSW